MLLALLLALAAAQHAENDSHELESAPLKLEHALEAPPPALDEHDAAEAAERLEQAEARLVDLEAAVEERDEALDGLAEQSNRLLELLELTVDDLDPALDLADADEGGA